MNPVDFLLEFMKETGWKSHTTKCQIYLNQNSFLYLSEVQSYAKMQICFVNVVLTTFTIQVSWIYIKIAKGWEGILA